MNVRSLFALGHTFYAPRPDRVASGRKMTGRLQDAIGFIAISAIVSPMAFGQLWSNVLSPSRAIDWTTAGAGPAPVRQNCSTQPNLAPGSGSASANTTAIQNAVASCAGYQVNLPAGTWYVAGLAVQKNNVTLAGAGADQTILIFTTRNGCGGFFGNLCIWNGDGNYSAGPTNTANWTSNYSAGTTNITLDNYSQLKVGMLLGLDQLNDTYDVSGTSTCSTSSGIPVVTANIGNFSRTPVIVTAQGFSVGGFNTPPSSAGPGAYPMPGGYTVTGFTSNTVSYSLAPATSCPSSTATGGTLTLDDGAFTVTNDGTFAAVNTAGNNPGRPGNGGACPAPAAGGGGLQCRSALQWVTVTGCGPTTAGSACTSGNITISPGVRDPQIRADRSPGAWWGSKLPISGVVVASMTLDGSQVSAGGTNNISCYNCSDDWVYGMRSYEAQSIHVVLWQSAHNTILSNYFYGIQGHGGSATQSYATDVYAGSSDNLFANNIYQHVAVSMQNEGGMGNVYFYNFCIDNDNSAEPDFPLGDYIQHAAGTMFDLTEGNECGHVTLDNFHGSNGGMWTSYRNLWRGSQPGYIWQTSALQAATGSRNWNMVGSVLGLPGTHTSFVWPSYVPPCTSTQCASGYLPHGAAASVLNLGLSGLETSRIFTQNCNNYCPIDDMSVDLPSQSPKGTGMAWGNVDVVTGVTNPKFCGSSTDPDWDTLCRSQSEIPTNLAQFAATPPTLGDVAAGQGPLPPSLYGCGYFGMFAKTPWGTGTCPSVGPDVTGGNIPGYGGHAWYIPAATALQNLTIDPAYSVVSSVTGATCTTSSGNSTVTLTIGSQASNIDLSTIIVVTGMNPSGYNTPANNLTQVSATNGNTVSYSVPSCPGPFISGGSATAPTVFSYNATTIYGGTTGGPGASSNGPPAPTGLTGSVVQ